MEPSFDDDNLEIWKIVEHEGMFPKKDALMASQSPSLKKSITLPSGRGGAKLK
jgi:hypothetical protein